MPNRLYRLIFGKRKTEVIHREKETHLFNMRIKPIGWEGPFRYIEEFDAIGEKKRKISSAL